MTEQELDNAIARLHHVDLDQLEPLLESVPEPDHADGADVRALRRLLLRIPAQWSRVLSVGPGWYKLLVALEKSLTEVDADFEIQQIKEKFGTLSFYAELGPATYKGPSRVTYPDYTSVSTEQGRKALESQHHKVLKAFNDSKVHWLASADGQAYEKKRQQFQQLIADASVASATTCENCGNAGAQIVKNQSWMPWFKTLCPVCQEKQGLLTSDQWQQWADKEAPKKLAEDRARTTQHYQSKHCLMVSEHPVAPLFECIQANSPEKAVAAIDQQWDVVFVDQDDSGKAFVNALIEKHAPHLQVIEQLRQDNQGKSFVVPRPESAPTLIFFKAVPVDDAKQYQAYCFARGMLSQSMFDDQSWSTLQNR